MSKLQKQPLAQSVITVRFIGAREAERRIGVSRWTIWRQEKAGVFPKSLKVGSKRVWIEAEVDEWMAAQIAQRDNGSVA